jgi:hypothetical protein
MTCLDTRPRAVLPCKSRKKRSLLHGEYRLSIGAPGTIRTSDPQIRSQVVMNAWWPATFPRLLIPEALGSYSVRDKALRSGIPRRRPQLTGSRDPLLLQECLEPIRVGAQES